MGKFTKYLFKSILLFGMLFSASVLQAQQVVGDSYEKAKREGKGTILVTYVETPGFLYKENTGRLTGVCMDIMYDFIDYVEANHGIELRLKIAGNGSSFRAMYDGAKGGKDGVFGLGNVTITDARRAEVQFSPAIIKNYSVLVSHNSVPTLTNMKDFEKVFKGYTAYTGRGTLNERRILEMREKYYPGLKIVQTSSSPEVLAKVINNNKSFSYLDLAFYLDALKNRHPLKRHEIADTKSEEFGIVMPMNSDWAPLMQEFFDANGGYTNSQEYKQILIEHLGIEAIKLIEEAK
ncbi:transporter substrate-binding domain-containing protein [Cytophagales bacterium LB-30]|uniref:Transporter substrate-binding domain-containing protein n=1 Tax=Shiella aurantiaca TaxID=3058365 RepID=A0ABT8F905_9BACT|nr:transporter substrate-binding domain-containing protein [Shiella aurantiaca]MDN4166962.1 transporter substrate-binding domain-containing protein [Shiella aurantiaca]